MFLLNEDPKLIVLRDVQGPFRILRFPLLNHHHKMPQITITIIVLTTVTVTTTTRQSLSTLTKHYYYKYQQQYNVLSLSLSQWVKTLTWCLPPTSLPGCPPVRQQCLWVGEWHRERPLWIWLQGTVFALLHTRNHLHSESLFTEIDECFTSDCMLIPPGSLGRLDPTGSLCGRSTVKETWRV